MFPEAPPSEGSKRSESREEADQRRRVCAYHAGVTSDDERLAADLGHELGNWLAAARMTAHLLGAEAAERGVHEDARIIEYSVARAAAGLATLRTLQREPAPESVSPETLADAARRFVGDVVEVRLRPEPPLPRVCVDAEGFVQLLALLLLADAGPLRLHLTAQGGEVVFTLVRPASAEMSSLLELAGRLLGRWGGRVAVTTDEWSLHLPGLEDGASVGHTARP